MELRKVRDEMDAQRVIAAASASGLPRRVWARSNGIDPRSLNAWRMNLARRRPRDVDGALRVVELTELRTTSVAAVYAVCVGEYRLELGDDFRDDTLRRMVGVLRSC